jgi:ParB/RepB/Spo0J family partition protein
MKKPSKFQSPKLRKTGTIPRAAAVKQPVGHKVATQDPMENPARQLLEECRAEARRTKRSTLDVLRETYTEANFWRERLEKLYEQGELCGGCYKDPCECLPDDAPCDPEVEDFREGFDLNRIAKDLGHTPNAMAGQVLDSAKSRHDAETNGGAHKAEAAPKKTPLNDTLMQLPEAIPVGKIRPFEFQVRKHFDQAALEQLAARIKKLGQLQEAIVRPASPPKGKDRVQGEPWYELIAGERRWRACKLAGVHTLRARIVSVTDEEAIEIHGAENLDDESLNPIEEATWLKLMIDKCGATQESIARKFKQQAEASAKNGKKAKAKGPQSQGAVSNLLRLLELPDELQVKIAEGKLPTSHAVMLVPHARRPEFVREFLKVLKNDEGALPLSDFDRQIGHAYEKAFVSPEYYKNGIHQEPLALKHAEELGVVEYTTRHGGSGTAITNSARWQEIVAAAEKKAREIADRQDRRNEQRRKAAAAKLSPAALKERAKENAAKHRKRVERWYIAWLQRQIAERLDFSQGAPVTIKLLLLFCTADTRQRSSDDIRQAMKTLGLKPASGFGWSLFAPIANDGNWPAKLAIETLKKWVVRDAEQHYSNLRPADVRAISREMSIDVGKQWTLDESFLQLFSKDQLADLALEWRMVKSGTSFGDRKRSEAITQILDQAKDRRLPTPAILLELAKAK